MVVKSLKDLASDEPAGGPGVSDKPIDGEKLSTDFKGLYHEKQVRIALCCEGGARARGAPRCAPTGLFVPPLRSLRLHMVHRRR